MTIEPNSFGPMVAQLTRDRTPPKRRAKQPGVLIFTLKRGLKVVSGADVHNRALAMQATLLEARGKGGGIVPLLRPRNAKDATRLIRDLERYDVHRVKSRTPVRFAAAREQLTSIKFRSALLAICPATENWKRIDIAKWLHAELLRPGSTVRDSAEVYAPDFLAAKRSVSWIYRRLGKKMSR